MLKTASAAGQIAGDRSGGASDQLGGGPWVPTSAIGPLTGEYCNAGPDVFWPGADAPNAPAEAVTRPLIGRQGRDSAHDDDCAPGRLA